MTQRRASTRIRTSSPAATATSSPTGRSPGSAAPVDVSGGWFDAGDYLKFTFTASYADDLLYSSELALGANAPASLTAEAAFGTQWLNKMWNPSTRTLYLQVGIGTGNETSFYGDHDLWRLPQADDSDSNKMDVYAAKNRPVFEAAAPGATIDPDVVGRVAAAFAFAARAQARSDPSGARTELNDATSLYAMADTSPSGTLASALPTAYYPEPIWHDAMELAAAEIARAQQDLGDPSPTYLPYVTDAAQYASDYISERLRQGHLQPLRHQRARAHRPDRRDQGREQPDRAGGRPVGPDRQPQGAAEHGVDQGSRRHLPRGRRLRQLRRGLAHLRPDRDRGHVPEGQR